MDVIIVSLSSGEIEGEVHLDGGCEGMVDECVATEAEGLTISTPDDPEAAGIRYCVPCLMSDYTDITDVRFSRPEDEL